MDCSTPGSPVHHQLQELAQTHVHRVSGAIHHLMLCYPFSSCLQSFQASGSFPVSHLFPSGGQSTGVLASASALPMNIQGWFPLGLTGGSPWGPRILKSLLQHHSSNTSILWCSAFFMVQLSHPYKTTGKKHSFDSENLCWRSDISAL